MKNIIKYVLMIIVMLALDFAYMFLFMKFDSFILESFIVFFAIECFIVTFIKKLNAFLGK